MLTLDGAAGVFAEAIGVTSAEDGISVGTFPSLVAGD